MDELTPAEAKAIVEEVYAWHAAASTYPERWQVAALKVYRTLPMELYSAYYTNGVMLVWYREESGRLRPAEAYTYTAPEYARKQPGAAGPQE